MPAASPRGSALRSSVLGEVCWAASASPGGRRDPPASPGHREGPGAGQGAEEGPPQATSLGHPTGAPRTGRGGPLGRAGYLRGPSRRGPRCHLGAGCRRLQAQHRALGPGRPRGRRAADQAGLADVPAGQLAAARPRPAALLEQRVGEARGSPAGASVGHRDHVGPLRAPLGLRGKRRRELPFVGAPRRPGSEEHHAAAQQDSGQDQHGQHGRQHHAAAACGDRPGRLGMEQHLAAGASPSPGSLLGTRVGMSGPYLWLFPKSPARSRALPSRGRSDIRACGCTPGRRGESVRVVAVRPGPAAALGGGISARTPWLLHLAEQFLSP